MTARTNFTSQTSQSIPRTFRIANDEGNESPLLNFGTVLNVQISNPHELITAKSVSDASKEWTITALGSATAWVSTTTNTSCNFSFTAQCAVCLKQCS